MVVWQRTPPWHPRQQLHRWLQLRRLGGVPQTRRLPGRVAVGGEPQQHQRVLLQRPAVGEVCLLPPPLRRRDGA